MPNIREYNSPIDKLQPSEAGSAAWEQAGRRLGSLGMEGAALEDRAYEALGRAVGTTGAQVADQVEKHQALQEISTGAAGLANLHAQLNQDWQDTAKNADPNDPSVAAKWRASIEPKFEDFIGSFKTDAGQRWANEEVASLRQHLFEKTAADQSTMAGNALVQNLDVLKNRASSLVRQDPSSLDATLGLVDNAVAALVKNSPTLTADQASKVHTDLTQHIKSEIARSAVLGVADRNPKAAVDLLNSGKLNDYIDGSTAKQLQDYAITVNRMAQEQQRVNEAETRRQNTEAANTKAGKIISDLVQPDGSLRVGQDYYKQVKTVATMPNATPGLARSMVDLGLALRKEQIGEAQIGTTDPLLYGQLWSKMLRAPNDPSALSLKDVFDARAAGHLTDKDFVFFKDAVESLSKDPAKQAAYKDFDTFLLGLKASITKSNPLLPTIDPQGDQRYGQFQHDMGELFARAYADGTWRNLLNPRDPSYLGRFLPNYQANTKAGMKGLSDDVVRRVTQTPSLVPPAPEPVLGHPPSPPAPPTAHESGVEVFMDRLQGAGKWLFGGREVPAAEAAPEQPPAKRLPGESAADFLKRTGEQ